MSLNSAQFKSYLAGFLDGDGSIYVRAKPNSSYRYGYQIAPYVAFFQSASCKLFPDLCKKVGYGSIRLRKDGIYEFTISKREEIIDFLEKISPYLELKQRQAKLMLEILERKKAVTDKQDFRELLKRIDTFRDLNYSKKRKVR
ncbi:MAG: LAGLIDADG family homing endonuclease [Candidatus Paceibacterota bacterium]